MVQKRMPDNEVLVAILNNHLDFAILREKHWYRIPVDSVEKYLKSCWPPKWLAFYQTKTFGGDAYAVNYYAKVSDILEVYRWRLFPDEPRNDPKSNRRYRQIIVEPIRRLPKPIFSRRQRRIVFIPTTWEKFDQAVEINDLYNESPLEDRLWAEFKRLQIWAERQELVTVKKKDYLLDFAIYCVSGKLDIETDGDTYHAHPVKAAEDNLRNNDLETAQWKVLRFASHQVRQEAVDYCISTIVENINRLGGIDEGKLLPRKINLNEKGSYQLSLFDPLK